MSMPVVTTGEARERLSKIAAAFDAGDVEPVIFGSHRRPQAVILPFSVWERLLAETEDELDTEVARERSAKSRRRLSHDEVVKRLAAGRAQGKGASAA